jgi:hypothetical protein
MKSILKKAKVQFPSTDGSYKKTSSELGEAIVEELAEREAMFKDFSERFRIVESGIRQLNQHNQLIVNDVKTLAGMVSAMEQRRSRLIEANTSLEESSHNPEETELKGE